MKCWGKFCHYCTREEARRERLTRKYDDRRVKRRLGRRALDPEVPKGEELGDKPAKICDLGNIYMEIHGDFMEDNPLIMIKSPWISMTIHHDDFPMIIRLLSSEH